MTDSVHQNNSGSCIYHRVPLNFLRYETRFALRNTEKAPLDDNASCVTPFRPVHNEASSPILFAFYTHQAESALCGRCMRAR